MSTAFDDVLAVAESPDHVRKRSVRVLLRQDLVERHAELDARLMSTPNEDGIGGAGAAVRETADEITALEAEIDSAQVTFTFRAVGHMKWANLMAEHPPTKDQLKANPRLDHNPETFPIAAMAATCVDPEGASVESFRRLEASSLPISVFDTLWSACLDANLGGGAPKSVAAGAIRRLSGRSASTPAPAASPDPSSSGA